jgi:hypothetical protein
MDLLAEIFRALLMAGLPIALFTLALVRWALQNGHFQEVSDRKALEREMAAMKKVRKNKSPEDKARQHPLQKKWAKFGGGFYGIVAFFTYIVVEVTDIATTISNFGGFTDFIKMLDVSVIVAMLIEALTNFITAMVWPVYWMTEIDTNFTWLWFVVAYAGYWQGLKLAQRLHRQRQPADN